LAQSLQSVLQSPEKQGGGLVASERERLVHRIADLEADLASLVSETAFYSGSGNLGKDPLPEAIVSIKGEIARCKAELDRVNASRT
jgi:hypothetical protein